MPDEPSLVERALLGVYLDAEAYLLNAATRRLRDVVDAEQRDEDRLRIEGLRAVQAAALAVQRALDGGHPRHARRDPHRSRRPNALGSPTA